MGCQGTYRALKEKPWGCLRGRERISGLDGKELGFGDWKTLSSNPDSTLTPLMAGVWANCLRAPASFLCLCNGVVMEDPWKVAGRYNEGMHVKCSDGARLTVSAPHMPAVAFICCCSEKWWALQTQNLAMSRGTTTWQKPHLPRARIPSRAQDLAGGYSQGPGLPHWWIERDVWGAFQTREVTPSLRYGSSSGTSPEGAAASAGFQTLQLFPLGMCLCTHMKVEG